ncbi:uncharacterized protein LOC131875911 [Cryptomeria japonica]|uniref:uncharacterized protein LOC131875911 n=1 Tax=Cryptomeria japonica TaxID=3369 RepID=UPI0027DA4F6C|nr:uncharacterized protein LOC131875911 [Cryptomeria japonica]
MSVAKLDEMLAIQKTLKEKIGLGFEIGECSHQKTKDKIKSNSVEKKEHVQPAKEKQVRNQKEKPPVKKPNSQTYFSFNASKSNVVVGGDGGGGDGGEGGGGGGFCGAGRGGGSGGGFGGGGGGGGRLQRREDREAKIVARDIQLFAQEAELTIVMQERDDLADRLRELQDRGRVVAKAQV